MYVMIDCTWKEKIGEEDINHWEQFMKKRGYMLGAICLCLWNKRSLDTKKESDSIKSKMILTEQTKGKAVQSEGEGMKLEGKIL